MNRYTVSLAIVSSLIAGSANAQESWICTYPGYPQNSAPVIDRFRVDGETFIEDTFQLRYRILQNTPFAVVAAWSIAEIELKQTCFVLSTCGIRLWGS